MTDLTHLVPAAGEQPVFAADGGPVTLPAPATTTAVSTGDRPTVWPRPAPTTAAPARPDLHTAPAELRRMLLRDRSDAQVVALRKAIAESPVWKGLAEDPKTVSRMLRASLDETADDGPVACGLRALAGRLAVSSYGDRNVQACLHVMLREQLVAGMRDARLDPDREAIEKHAEHFLAGQISAEAYQGRMLQTIVRLERPVEEAVLSESHQHVRQELAHLGLTAVNQALPADLAALLAHPVSDGLDNEMGVRYARILSMARQKDEHQLYDAFRQATLKSLSRFDSLRTKDFECAPGSQAAQDLRRRLVAGVRVVGETLVNASPLSAEKKAAASAAIASGVGEWLGSPAWDEEIVELWPDDQPLARDVIQTWRRQLFEHGADAGRRTGAQQLGLPLFPVWLADLLTGKIAALWPAEVDGISRAASLLLDTFDRCLALEELEGVDAERLKARCRQQVNALINRAISSVNPDRV